jgi:hypothetical protein
MKTILKKMLGLALFGLLGSVGFAEEKPPEEANSRYTFTKGDFHITLVIGPEWRAAADGALPHSTSYYRISKKLNNGEGKQEWSYTYLGSALHTFHTDRKPDYIKFHVSESGDTLLIEEPVPNDCNEVTNYILIKTENGNHFGSHLNARYLEAKNAKGKSFTFEQEMDWGVAQVRSITNSTITFYLREEKIKDWTLKFDDLIQKEQLPRFPG